MGIWGEWVEGLGCQEPARLGSGSPPGALGMPLSPLVSTLPSYLAAADPACGSEVPWNIGGDPTGVPSSSRFGTAGLSGAAGAGAPRTGGCLRASGLPVEWDSWAAHFRACCAHKLILGKGG